MSSLNPIENGLTSDEEQEAPETLSNPSPPPSETIERVENYNCHSRFCHPKYTRIIRPQQNISRGKYCQVLSLSLGESL